MTYKQAATLNIKDVNNLPLCPNCYLPFKCRAKRSVFQKFIFGSQNLKKYWCGKCNSTFSFIEKKG